MSEVSLRNIVIPVIKHGEVIIIEQEEYISVFYGERSTVCLGMALFGTPPKKFLDAIEPYSDREAVYPFDFRKGTRFNGKYWMVLDHLKCNLFINTESSDATALVSEGDSNSEHEFALWFMCKKPE